MTVMTARLDSKTEALKRIVVVMGALIVIGLVVVVATIASRLSALGGKSAREERRPSAFAEASLAVPVGCRVVEMRPAGERLLLRLAEGPRCEEVLVVDLGSGALLGRIRLAPTE
jgi:hypothetical protein